MTQGLQVWDVIELPIDIKRDEPGEAWLVDRVFAKDEGHAKWICESNGHRVNDGCVWIVRHRDDR